MADYLQTPNRPNIKPTDLPPPLPPGDQPTRDGVGLGPVLGAVAVVGIVALVAWGVTSGNRADEPGTTTPAASQTAPAVPGVTPVAPAAPTPAPQEVPDTTPQELPTPATEVAPAPTPAPAPAPSN